MFQAFYVIMVPRHRLGAIKILVEALAQDFDEKRALAAATDAGNSYKFTKRNMQIKLFQIILPGAINA